MLHTSGSGTIVKYAPKGTEKTGTVSRHLEDRHAVHYEDDDTIWWCDLENEEDELSPELNPNPNPKLTQGTRIRQEVDQC